MSPVLRACLLMLLAGGTSALSAEELPPEFGHSPLAAGMPAFSSGPLYRPEKLSLERQLYQEPPVREWEFLPTGFLYPTYWASAAEPRLGTQFVREEDGSYQDSSIGGRLGLLRFGPADSADGFQLDLLAGAKLRQDTATHWEVYSTDYRWDLLATWGDGPHRYKFGYYHVSSHVGDQYWLRHPAFPRENYFRDALAAGYSYYPIPELRLYAEAGLAFRYDVSEPWEFQFGADYGPAEPTGPKGAPFAAVNAHLRQELDFGGNIAGQLGWAWRGDKRAQGILRAGLYVYEGASPQFTFYDEHERQLGVGLWYDF